MSIRLKYIIAIFTAFVLLVVSVKSFYYTEKFGGFDLRYHIIASRLLPTNHSPYFYKPGLSDGDFYFLGHGYGNMLSNGTTVTPSMLFLLYPLSALPYKTIRMLWLIIQFLLLGITIFFVAKKKDTDKDNFLPLIMIILGLLCSNIWLMHIERGQVYIFYTSIVALAYGYYKSKGRYHAFISGFIIGILLLIRPLAGIFVVPFLLQKMKDWLYGWVTGVVVGCILFVAPRPFLWHEYFFAMQSRVNGVTIKTTNSDTTGSVVYPKVIEGMDNINTYSLFNAGNLDTFHNYVQLAGVNITMNQSMLVYCIIAIILSAFFCRVPFNEISAEELFLFGTLLYILSEVFTVAPRSTYCLVEWIPALFIMVKKMQRNKPFLLFIILSLLMLHAFPFNFPFQFDIAELMLLFGLIFAIFENPILEKLKIKP